MYAIVETENDTVLNVFVANTKEEIKTIVSKWTTVGRRRDGESPFNEEDLEAIFDSGSISTEDYTRLSIINLNGAKTIDDLDAFIKELDGENEIDW